MGRTHSLSDQQIAQLVLDVRAGTPDTQIAAALGVTPNAIQYWKRFARVDADWVRHLRILEHELVILRRRLSLRSRQLELATGAIKALVGNTNRRVSLAQQLKASSGLKHAHANEIFALTPSAGLSVNSRANDGVILTRIRAYVDMNPGHGMTRIWDNEFGDRPCSYNQYRSVYREHGMQMNGRKPRPWKPTAAHTVIRKPVPESRDEVWSADWMMANVGNRRCWILQVIDEFSRECLICIASKHATAIGLVAALTALATEGRKPVCVRSDNGRQFRSALYRRWAWREGIAIRYTRYRTPQDNVFVERLHLTLRNELLAHYTFETLNELQEGLDRWTWEYNQARPHRALGMTTPCQIGRGLRSDRRNAHRSGLSMSTGAPSSS